MEHFFLLGLRSLFGKILSLWSGEVNIVNMLLAFLILAKNFWRFDEQVLTSFSRRHAFGSLNVYCHLAFVRFIHDGWPERTNDFLRCIQTYHLRLKPVEMLVNLLNMVLCRYFHKWLFTSIVDMELKKTRPHWSETSQRRNCKMRTKARQPIYQQCFGSLFQTNSAQQPYPSADATGHFSISFGFHAFANLQWAIYASLIVRFPNVLSSHWNSPNLWN